MAYQIKRWTDGSVIYEHGETAKECLENGVERNTSFAYANLFGAELSHAKLFYAKLSHAELSHAELSGAKLYGADLSYAELSGAELSHAELSGAKLSGAKLYDAELSGAELSGAELSGAKLYRAKLYDAELSDADLHSIKYEFFGKLALQFNEINGLRQAIIDGKINGSSYEGECACFVGTIANVAHTNYTALSMPPKSDSLTERWFLAIKTGDTPETNPVARITLEWIDEFLAKTNIPASSAFPAQN